MYRQSQFNQRQTLSKSALGQVLSLDSGTRSASRTRIRLACPKDIKNQANSVNIVWHLRCNLIYGDFVKKRMN
jgi:hypothetical protein